MVLALRTASRISFSGNGRNTRMFRYPTFSPFYRSSSTTQRVVLIIEPTPAMVTSASSQYASSRRS